MKVLIIDPWGIKNTSEYLNGLAYGISLNADLTLATNYYFEKKTDSNYKIERVFFKKSENRKKGLYRKIIRIMEYLSGYNKIIKLIKKNNYDIIHINWLLNYKQDIYFLKKIKRITSAKVIYTAHNVIPHTNGAKSISLLKKIYSLVDRIVLHGNSIKQEFVDLFPSYSDKVYVQYHGCNLDLCDKMDNIFINEKYANILKKYDLIFIAFGLIFYNKGIDRIAKYWIDRNPNALLIIAGQQKGNYKELDELKPIISERKNILYLDYYVDDNTLNYLLSMSDLIVLPYRHASMSGVVFTAAEYKKTILTTDVGSISEYLEDNVDSIVCQNSDAIFYDNLDKLLLYDKAKLKKMGEMLYLNISKKYDWKVICHKLFSELYDE